MNNNKLGTSKKPRISVFRSNRNITAQFIDDEKGVTLVALSSKKIEKKATPVERAFETGKELAKAAKAKKIAEAKFDRNGFRYQGQVKALADGLREGGISI